MALWGEDPAVELKARRGGRSLALRRREGTRRSASGTGLRGSGLPLRSTRWSRHALGRNYTIIAHGRRNTSGPVAATTAPFVGPLNDDADVSSRNVGTLLRLFVAADANIRSVAYGSVGIEIAVRIDTALHARVGETQSRVARAGAIRGAQALDASTVEAVGGRVTTRIVDKALAPVIHAGRSRVRALPVVEALDARPIFAEKRIGTRSLSGATAA